MVLYIWRGGDVRDDALAEIAAIGAFPNAPIR
jgi:hypothetical protein